jgi:uncharacterized DUF497 family protein
MNAMRFIWDQAKAAKNLRKHRISFEEGCTVFADENARLKHDPDHSLEEDRFILLGFSDRSRPLVVCHSYSENDEVIRIISARKATPSERKHYGRYL